MLDKGRIKGLPGASSVTLRKGRETSAVGIDELFSVCLHWCVCVGVPQRGGGGAEHWGEVFPFLPLVLKILLVFTL